MMASGCEPLAVRVHALERNGPRTLRRQRHAGLKLIACRFVPRACLGDACARVLRRVLPSCQFWTLCLAASLKLLLDFGSGLTCLKDVLGMLVACSRRMTDGFALVQARTYCSIPLPPAVEARTALALRRAAAKCFEMLACIACSTKDGGDQDGGPRAATPHGRDAGSKSLTSQVEYSHPTPCTLPHTTWIMDVTAADTAAGRTRNETRRWICCAARAPAARAVVLLGLGRGH